MSDKPEPTAEEKMTDVLPGECEIRCSTPEYPKYR